MKITRAAFLVSACVAMVPLPALSNGFGEATGFQFRSPADRQILLLQEQTRLNFRNSNRVGVGGVGAQGIGQTGNQITITISGNGDNTITLDQDNSGDQSIQDIDGNGNSSTSGQIAGDAISAAADALVDID